MATIITSNDQEGVVFHPLPVSYLIKDHFCLIMYKNCNPFISCPAMITLSLFINTIMIQ